MPFIFIFIIFIIIIIIIIIVIIIHGKQTIITRVYIKFLLG